MKSYLIFMCFVTFGMKKETHINEENKIDNSELMDANLSSEKPFDEEEKDLKEEHIKQRNLLEDSNNEIFEAFFENKSHHYFDHFKRISERGNEFSLNSCSRHNIGFKSKIEEKKASIQQSIMDNNIEENEEIILLLSIYEEYKKVFENNYHDNKIIILPTPINLLVITCEELCENIQNKLSQKCTALMIKELLEKKNKYHQMISDLEAFDEYILCFNDLQQLLDFMKIYTNTELDVQDSINMYALCVLKYLKALGLTNIDANNFIHKKDELEKVDFIVKTINTSEHKKWLTNNKCLNVINYLELIQQKYNSLIDNSTRLFPMGTSHNPVDIEGNHEISCQEIHNNSIVIAHQDLTKNITTFFSDIKKIFSKIMGESVKFYFPILELMIHQLIVNLKQYMISKNIYINHSVKTNKYDNSQEQLQSNLLVHYTLNNINVVMKELYAMIMENTEIKEQVFSGIENLIDHFLEVKREKEYKKIQGKCENFNISEKEINEKQEQLQKESSKCIIY